MKKVNIQVEIVPSCETPRIIIQTDRHSPLVDSITEAIERCAGFPQIPGYRGDTLVLIGQEEIQRIYTENRRLILHTASGKYEARRPLREIEEALDPEYFVRISRFEIVNLHKIVSFDCKFEGTIRVAFDDGSVTWVARRYVRAIQETLNRL